MKSKKFTDFLKNISSDPLRVMDGSISNAKYIPIDLSESSQTLNTVDLSSSTKLGVFVNNHIKKHDALVAYGGYLEVRNIYKRSNYFNSQAEDERNIHLGIDLWCEAETPIYTPLDGTVHSYKNNTNYGDYGPTIILKHHISGVEFYTLYGHLSLASIEKINEGQVFKQGAKIATLGDASVNGDYPPHLHVQIIKDIQGFKGDYPGVCSKRHLEFYKTNCPNPNLLLKYGK
ncbi:MAG: peptidoglycan DD-metalloendopeptidase family protein [Algibacter sp.]|uniref:peptidoglycan DD-metalloendopeptidase family protein n=1 Tax=Algibacter sp. TaxID=1872428 RepID=UPI0026235BD0|nr:peptidoglycan DD-metalloendopeptidase family protein [Algibacter sp.]MDG1730145.1 peptidoglycan DD-metalloendopeptidase family protein [Algibacter sp.]MDG2179205.1 peptidoglycan DD-metalloendopeptidase family protein [Algibacter sp.]